MTKEQINAMQNAATFTPSDNIAKELLITLRLVNKTYHFCPEFDGLVICDEDWEHGHCYCDVHSFA